jgi:hypothetical protein
MVMVHQVTLLFKNFTDIVLYLTRLKTYVENNVDQLLIIRKVSN